MVSLELSRTSIPIPVTIDLTGEAIFSISVEFLGVGTKSVVDIINDHIS
jgi:hypothetical protein